MNPYQEFLSCQQDFSYFVENYIKISDPIIGLIPLELHPFQKELIKAYEEKEFVLAVKFRKGGFTTITVLYGLWLCMFHSNVYFYVASRTENEACHVGKLIDKVIEKLPKWLQPKLEKNTKSCKKFSITGCQMMFGNCESTRGKIITHLFIDEAAFIKKLDNSFIRNRTEMGCRIIAISTTNGLGNWFSETWFKTINGVNSVHAVKSNYKDHPIYANEDYVAIVREQLGEEGFRQEILGEFIIEQPKYSSIDFSNLSKEDLIKQVGHILVHKNKLSLEEQNLIFEMIRRFT